MLAFFTKCSPENNHLFTLVPPEQSGLDFQNTVEESDSLNILTVDYMCHGAGVAIGDFNNDDLSDIFFTGNIVPNKLFINNGNLKFTDVSSAAGIAGGNKWKSGVALADVNNDGWLDIYVCATIKKDSLERANMLFINKGLDKNGVPVFKDEALQYGVGAIISCYFKSEEGELKEYPVHSWDELYSQSPKFRNQFSSFKQYGLATMKDLLKPYDTTGMILLEANFPFTSYLSNRGDGTFEVRSLPKLVQVAPINGILVDDVNHDGNLDAIMVGNDYGNEVFSGRYDACSGIVLLGDGAGNFEYMSSNESGFLVDGDAKALGKLTTNSREILIATQNRDSLRMFQHASKNPPERNFMPMQNDSRVEFIFGNGTKQKIEFFHGSGYLSQSTRKIKIPADVTEMIVYDFSGNSRIVDFTGLAFGGRK